MLQYWLHDDYTEILKDEPPLRAIPKSTELQHFQFDHNDGNLNIVLKIRILQVFFGKERL